MSGISFEILGFSFEIIGISKIFDNRIYPVSPQKKNHHKFDLVVIQSIPCIDSLSKMN